MLNELLRVEQLSSGYHRIPVLNKVSFHIREGEMVAMIGPNGAGKTTLLKTISGLIPPASGQNVHHALSLADRGYVLENGHIVLEGACTALSQNPHIRQHYLGL